MFRDAVAILVVACLLVPTGLAQQEVPILPPSPPMNVQVEQTENGTLVTWDPPVFNGGSDDISYRVYRDDVLLADDVEELEFLDASIGTMSATVSYKYDVTAVNEAGESFIPGYCITLDPFAVHIPSCQAVVEGIVLWVVDIVVWIIENVP